LSPEDIKEGWPGKNKFLEEKCIEMEKEKDIRKAFRILKEVTGKWTPRSNVINDENGNALTESEDIKKRWVEYCTNLYSCDQPHQTPNPRYNEVEKEPPPLKSEIEWALRRINNGKSPGIDGIPIEMWKASGDEGVDILWRLCRLIWEKEEWPKDWCRAVFVPLPKKGNLKECSNHRTISLITHASKVMLKIIINRMKTKYDLEMAEEQAGFVDGKGTREQIVNIRNIIEKCREHNVPLYMCFIDYAKAFDCVCHEQLWQDMQDMGFPEHLVNLIRKLYENQESAVRTDDGNTDWFEIGRGVRQGCVMSPSLYNIYSEVIMREVLEDHDGGITIGGSKNTNLRFADDTTLLCSTKSELLQLLQRTKEVSEHKGLILNTKKTKIMVVDRNRTDHSDFKLGGEKIE
jgi:hypothetical protein